jgi:hypothetical protein
MGNIVKVDFQLLGTAVPPHEITKMTGVAPDVELMRGQRNEERDLPRQNIWSKQSRVDSEDVSAHWADLASALTDSKEIFKELARGGRAEITIVVTSKDRIPSIRIPPEMSEFAGFVNAVIDVDHIQY